jgi:Flp pilus assembly protein TadD
MSKKGNLQELGFNDKTGSAINIGVNQDKAISDKRNTHLLIFLSIAIVVLVLTTYWNAFNNDFVDWDDFTYVVNNDLVRNPGNAFVKDLFTTPISSNYHPLTILSLRLNNNVCASCPNGISPAPFIRWNVILHMLNALLVLILVYLLSNNNILVSFITAAIFAVHPMHVESVAWIAERKDVLYTFFFLAGLIAYLNFKRATKGKNLWLILTFLLFILINFWIYNTEEDKPIQKALENAVSIKNLLLLVPFFLVSVFLGLMAYRIQHGNNFMGILDLSKNVPDVVDKIANFSVLQRIQISSYGFVLYIIRFFAPFNLSAIYPYPDIQEFRQAPFAIFLFMAVAGVTLIAFLVIRSLRKTKLYAFSFAFYFVTIALVLQFITVGYAIMADRYSYLPYVGLSLIPATIISKSSKTGKTILLIIFSCFLVMLIFQARKQADVWSNTETLWSNAIMRYPHQELPRRSRGKYYGKMSLQAKNDTEMKMFEDKALIDFKEAIKAGTKSADVFQGAGVIYGSRGDLKNAILLLNAAISIDPKKGAAYYNRAIIYDKLNQKEDAIKDYNMALIYNPEKALEILNNRSNLFLETGRFREAIMDFDYLISIKSNNFLYFSNRAFARSKLNDFKGAVSDYQKALQLQPNDQFSRIQLQKLINL